MTTDTARQRAGVAQKIFAAVSAIVVAALIYLYRPEEGSSNVAGGWTFLLIWGMSTMALVQSTGSMISRAGRNRANHSDARIQSLAYGVVIGLLVASLAAEGGIDVGIQPEMLCWPILIAFGFPALLRRARRDNGRLGNVGHNDAALLK